jgi:hypothetical protein
MNLEQETAMDNPQHWIADGVSDDLANLPTIPAYLEVAPGEFRSIEECSAAEIIAAAGSKMMEARELTSEVSRMFNLADRQTS